MSIRVATMNGEVKYQGDVGPQGPAGPRGEQGNDGVSPVVQVNKIDGVTTVTITDKYGTKTTQIKDGEVTKEELENAVNEAKLYTDNEIATFDFIKVVNVLPEEGLPNKIYLVPKNDTQTQDLFDEYVWVNNAWEWITTKQLEIDLSDYATKEEVNSKVSSVNGKTGTVTLNANDVGAMPASTVVTTFWKGTQSEYDALGTYDATTLYLITE